MKLSVFLLVSVFLFSLNSLGSSFLPCHTEGENPDNEPHGAPQLYQIVKGVGPAHLKACENYSRCTNEKPNIFYLMIWDKRFSSYKCWDKNKSLTGFDVELLSDILSAMGYSHIQFVLRPFNGVLNWFDELNRGVGNADALSSGISMNPEREKVAHMVGPIYKAGKLLIGRIDNPILSGKDLTKVPATGYNLLKGLKIAVHKGSIRSRFFEELAAHQPGLVNMVVTGDSGQILNHLSSEEVGNLDSKDKINVLAAQADEMSRIINSRFSKKVHGARFDLAMIDTGSRQQYENDGILGQEVQILSSDLGLDPQIGHVFGKGDGVIFRFKDPRIPQFTQLLKERVRSGFVNQLVKKWFADSNYADHSWADEAR